MAKKATATKRRGTGEGAVYQRPDGRWTATVERGLRPKLDKRGRAVLGPDGLPIMARHRQQVYGKTKAEVLGKLHAAQNEVEKGMAALDRRTTIGDLLDSWLATLPGTIRATTEANYRAAVNNWIRPAVGTTKAVDLRPMHVEKLTGDMIKRGLSPTSARYARAVLRRALADAERHGLVHTNVAAAARGPRVGSAAKLDDVLTEKDAQKVLTVAGARNEGEPDRLFALAYLVLAYGIRKGEALGLRWDDIDLDSSDPTLTIRRSLARVAGAGLVAGETKTAQSERTIPLLDETVAVLREHKRRQATERLAAPQWADPGIVFADTVGGYIDPRNALRWWHSLCDEAKIGQRRFHATRHTAGTLLLNEGVALEVVSAILGHKSIRVTADVYAKPNADAMRRAIKRGVSAIKEAK